MSSKTYQIHNNSNSNISSRYMNNNNINNNKSVNNIEYNSNRISKDKDMLRIQLKAKIFELELHQKDYDMHLRIIVKDGHGHFF